MKQNILLITHNRVDLTAQNENFVRKKVRKLLRHATQIQRVCVELSMGRSRSSDPLFVARGIAELPGPFLVAVATSPNLYSAVEEMVRKLDRRVRRRQRVRLFKRVRFRPIDIPAQIPKAASPNVVEAKAA